MLTAEAIIGREPLLRQSSPFAHYLGTVQSYAGYIMDGPRPLSFNEKFAAGLLVLFGPIYLAAAASLKPDSVLTAGDFRAVIVWHISWTIIVFVAFCAAAATVFLKPAHHTSHIRMHLGRLQPLTAMGVAILLSSVAMDALSSHQKKAFADLHQHDLAGKPPRAVVYRQGIPDGGIAIVRSPGRNPEGFTQAVMLELTGERIKSCEPMSDTDWACHFD